MKTWLQWMVVVLALGAPAGVVAQARAGDGNTATSPLASAYARLDEALAQKVVGADDAPGRWLSGRLAGFETAAQARDYATAVARDPKEMLYAASLAGACMRTGVPVPAECAERDVVGYWAARDGDNAVPWLLQAERARRRNAIPALVENLERAAKASRFDDYANRGAAVAWTRVAPLASAGEGAAAALYALTYARGGSAALEALESVCGPRTRALDERIPRACVRLGALMAERGTSLVDRRAGAQIALAATASESGKAAANETGRTVVAAQERCRDARGALEKAATGDATARAQAAGAAERYIATLATRGEAAACEELARGK